VSAFTAIAGVTLASLLGRRRTFLLVALAALPVVVALLARLGGARPDEAAILDALVVRTVLPLTTLVIGTAALGAEIEDGTVIYLLAKPISRWRLVGAKLAVAFVVGGTLAVTSAFLTGLVAGADTGPGLAVGVAVAVAMGAAAYTAAFVAASVITSRALVLGLFYTLIWEGVLAGILEGTRILSIREATLGIANSLVPGVGFGPGLAVESALILVVVVVVGGFAVATLRLERFELRGD
jgi:ABC-2 type transport system permease protein